MLIKYKDKNYGYVDMKKEIQGRTDWKPWGKEMYFTIKNGGIVMSSRGIMTNNLYVNIQINFEDAWNGLDSNEQKGVVSQNIELVKDDDLIAELEHRGYTVTKEEE